MTYSQWLAGATAKLKLVNPTSARLDAILLLESNTQTDRAYILSHPQADIPTNIQPSLDTHLQRRILGEPMAYILGKKEFYGREFVVSSSVLIPRPDTEMMIDLLIKYNSSARPGNKVLKLIDIGTGSGCIAVTAKMEIPELQVSGSDLSLDAINIAKLNARLLGADVNFSQSNLLDELDGCFDIITANLPYLPHDFEISPDVRFEPKLALYSAHHGLELIDRMLNQCTRKLSDGGLVLIESLEFQHTKINEIATLCRLQPIQRKGLIQVFKKQLARNEQ